MSKSRDAFRTISEVAEWLDTPAHVLRFWESKFTQVKPVKRAGGRRYYRPADMTLLGGIRKLLHDDGMTIKGVQKILREQGVRHVSSLSVHSVEDAEHCDSALIEDAPYMDVEPETPEPVDFAAALRARNGADDADAAGPALAEDVVPEEALAEEDPQDSAQDGAPQDAPAPWSDVEPEAEFEAADDSALTTAGAAPEPAGDAPEAAPVAAQAPADETIPATDAEAVPEAEAAAEPEPLSAHAPPKTEATAAALEDEPIAHESEPEAETGPEADVTALDAESVHDTDETLPSEAETAGDLQAEAEADAEAETEAEAMPLAEDMTEPMIAADAAEDDAAAPDEAMPETPADDLRKASRAIVLPEGLPDLDSLPEPGAGLLGIIAQTDRLSAAQARSVSRHMADLAALHDRLSAPLRR